ncbi:hypothetical protein [Sulfitobacter aestuariivivens]|uniref:Lipoprotein n=1 Tax=Sulfitobacter aestuariivivens TaxID=2766981 RepID=A0A927HGB7_9RHOB|nr:hypothetical protein [Sulfitobacter aestuariivivens]MBD3665801.1 hypothetical protein [Sulfitobacter aestuariivivens]
MMKFFKLFLLAIAGTLLVACESKPEYLVYERLILHFETPDGLKTASGVARKRYVYHPKDLPLTNTRITTSIVGEAILIDLGPGLHVVALLKRVDYNSVGYGAFNKDFDRNPTEILKALTQTPEKFSVRSVPTRSWPQLVVFEDLSEPTSVRRADRQDIFPGQEGVYALSSVEIQVLKKTPITRVISDAMPWLQSLERGPIDGTQVTMSKSRPLANELFRRDFVSGDGRQ